MINPTFSQKNSASADDDERSSLKPTGYFHTGELGNCFAEGSLVMSVLGESSVQPKSTYLFGSASGHVGLGKFNFYLCGEILAIFVRKQLWVKKICSGLIVDKVYFLKTPRDSFFVQSCARNNFTPGFTRDMFPP